MVLAHILRIFLKRENVFAKEAVSTSIAYRIVHENSLIFLANMTSYKKISEKALAEIEVIEKIIRIKWVIGN